MGIRCAGIFLVASLTACVVGNGELGVDAGAGSNAPDAGGGTTPLRYRGTSLSGAEFGAQTLPGVLGTDYTYPDATYVAGYTGPDYFAGKGMNTFRLPFLWERLQPQLETAFDASELARLDKTVADLLAKGAYVIVDPHNFARYRGQVVGSSAVPNAAFADLWSRLATHFAAQDHVIFGLMNEPHDMPTEQWRDAANAALAAIRTAGAHNLALVPGNAYTGAWSWGMTSYGTPNATAMLAITDPGGNMAFEVHQYLDSDYSGTHATCQSATIGADSLATLTAWLRANGKRAVLGEFAGGSDPTCLAAVDGMLASVAAASDVYLGWVWWSAGPWWYDASTNVNYMFSIEPHAGTDAKQLATLAAHLGP